MASVVADDISHERSTSSSSFSSSSSSSSSSSPSSSSSSGPFVPSDRYIDGPTICLQLNNSGQDAQRRDVEYSCAIKYFALLAEAIGDTDHTAVDDLTNIYDVPVEVFDVLMQVIRMQENADAPNKIQVKVPGIKYKPVKISGHNFQTNGLPAWLDVVFDRYHYNWNFAIDFVLGCQYLQCDFGLDLMEVFFAAHFYRISVSEIFEKVFPIVVDEPTGTTRCASTTSSSGPAAGGGGSSTSYSTSSSTGTGSSTSRVIHARFSDGPRRDFALHKKKAILPPEDSPFYGLARRVKEIKSFMIKVIKRI